MKLKLTRFITPGVVFFSKVLTGLIILIAFFSFVEKREETLTCPAVHISVDNAPTGNYFFDEEDVKSMIREKGLVLEGMNVSEIPVAGLEALLERNPYVLNAEVFVSVSGSVTIEVVQKTPVARVMGRNGEGYYIDRFGNMMPPSGKYVPRVMVATGLALPGYLEATDLRSDKGLSKTNDKQNILDSLNSLVNAILEDPFMLAQTEQIVVLEGGNFQIIPKFGRHDIRLGTCETLEEKFFKLKSLYSQFAGNPAMDDYETLDLTYANQVVCTKRTMNPKQTPQ